jgi:hypothetical protein
VLTLQEIERKRMNGKTVVSYEVVVFGVPEGKKLALWAKHLGSLPKPLEKEYEGLSLDPSGKLVWKKDGVPETVKLVLVDFSKGEPYEVALISSDQSVKAFGKVIPVPIEVTEGRCHLSVEIVSPKGDSFAIRGDGFEPDEEVTTTSRSGGEVLEDKTRVSARGTFLTVIFPGVIGKQADLASFTASGKFCKPMVRYDWGPSAFKAK